MPRGGARPNAGRKPSKTKADKPAKVTAEGFKSDPGWPFGQEIPPEPPAATDLTELSPLDYLLSVMRDEGEEKARRMQAASLAAPYVHAKKGEGGKKEEAADKAKKAAGGKFAAAAPPPKLVVNNK